MKPLISLIMPVYNTRTTWLEDCIASIMRQTFREWELCICNNGSTDPEVEKVLQDYAADDTRIKLNHIDVNEGGYKGLQKALELVTGEYTGLMDSDDLLPDFALNMISGVLIITKPKVLYTDEMIMDEQEHHIMPFIKPDFDRELLCFLHYFGHLTLYRTPLIRELGIYHCGGSYDYDLALRASEVLFDFEFKHIPQMLYYYRSYSGSTSAVTKNDCLTGGLEALNRHLDYIGKDVIPIMSDPFYNLRTPSGNVLKPDFSRADFHGCTYHLLKELYNL